MVFSQKDSLKYSSNKQENPGLKMIQYNMETNFDSRGKILL